MTKEEWRNLKKEKGMKVYVPKYWGHSSITPKGYDVYTLQGDTAGKSGRALREGPEARRQGRPAAGNPGAPCDGKAQKPYYDGRMAMPPEGNCAYCGRPLRKGEGHWVVDEFGQLVRKCNDSRSCYERMGEDNQKSLKRALKRFGVRGGM